MERALDQELAPDEGQALAQCGRGPYSFPLSLEEVVEQLISKSLRALTFYFQENTGCSQGTLLPLLIFPTPPRPWEELNLSAPGMAEGRSLEFDRVGR